MEDFQVCSFACLEVCVALDENYDHCGLFMPQSLFERYETPDEDSALRCNACWTQVVPRNPYATEHFQKQFGHDRVSEWPKFGCRSRMQPWNVVAMTVDPEVEPWQLWLCETRLLDINKNLRANLYFLADWLPLVVYDVLGENIQHFNDAVLGMSVEDFQASITAKVYRDPEWVSRLECIGYFPVSDHVKNQRGSYLTQAGWGLLLMKIAETNLKDLGPVFVLGADMYDQPTKYVPGGVYPKADYFENRTPEEMMMIKQEMDGRRELDDKPEGTLDVLRTCLWLRA